MQILMAPNWLRDLFKFYILVMDYVNCKNTDQYHIKLNRGKPVTSFLLFYFLLP